MSDRVHILSISGHCLILGVGVVSWSPLACGIITGKYENGVPDSSRASMKVQVSFLHDISTKINHKNESASNYL